MSAPACSAFDAIDTYPGASTGQLNFALLRAIFAGERGPDLHEVSGQNPMRGYTPGTR